MTNHTNTHKHRLLFGQSSCCWCGSKSPLLLPYRAISRSKSRAWIQRDSNHFALHVSLDLRKLFRMNNARTWRSSTSCKAIEKWRDDRGMNEQTRVAHWVCTQNARCVNQEDWEGICCFSHALARSADSEETRKWMGLINETFREKGWCEKNQLFCLRIVFITWDSWLAIEVNFMKTFEANKFLWQSKQWMEGRGKKSYFWLPTWIEESICSLTSHSQVEIIPLWAPADSSRKQNILLERESREIPGFFSQPPRRWHLSK